MALFSRTKKTETKAAAKESAAVSGMKADVSHVLLSPRITEKATATASVGVYVFDVDPSANKTQISSAFQTAYKVKPRAIRIVNIRPKMVRNARTGKSGVKQGGKKAYVYLAEGETVTIS